MPYWVGWRELSAPNHLMPVSANAWGMFGFARPVWPPVVISVLSNGSLYLLPKSMFCLISLSIVGRSAGSRSGWLHVWLVQRNLSLTSSRALVVGSPAYFLPCDGSAP